MKVLAWHDRQLGRFHDCTGTVLLECDFKEAVTVLGLKGTDIALSVGLERSPPEDFGSTLRWHAEGIVKALACFLAGLPESAVHDNVVSSPGERLLRLVKEFAAAERAKASDSEVAK